MRTDPSRIRLRDVLDSMEGDDIAEFLTQVFSAKMMDDFLEIYFENGKASLPVPTNEDWTYRERALVASFWTKCSNWSKKGFKRPRNRSRVECFQDIGAPSEFGKPSVWTTWQRDHDELQLMCLRPSECSLVNIRIIHPVFQEIIQLADSGTPTSQDYLFAAELNAAMPQAHVIENARRDTINSIFNKYVVDHAVNAISVQGIANGFGTDGTCKAAGTNLEYKNEKGNGDSDPYMQNIAYYVQYWGSNARSPLMHCCPWMLIEILGQEIGISGAVWSCGHPCCQPLTANIPFLQIPSDRQMRLKQARLCMAIRHGFKTLLDFYASSPSQVSDQAGFPFQRRCRMRIDDQEHEVELKYLNLFKREARRMLFVAQAEVGDQTQTVLVKFTDQYNQLAHSLAASAGFAPALYCAQDVAGMKMIVMELLTDSRPWPVYDATNSNNGKICSALENFLELFDQANLVHGDLRSPNVHVVQNRVYILDFDWAGIHGVDTYAVAVNPGEFWAEGVQVGETMLKQHDQRMVEKLLEGYH